ncbi:glycosyltransferase involved in cell wall biosynthesis [Metabacillus crassostreae]|uniref:glycosyltransferase n=1 Tax=Metabacillus crassostreae TaxID=929098 RepID=UPI001958E00B|nr:glycosyltransferase [Metabacillus crassostreae]MBM7603172.1 glycosyltransferase involved in cell wall biosynthesis [Metabacillus crassostreae]
MEKVSIIIPFYNCQYIDKAIESALSQTYQNKEIIVIDDGSSKYIDKINPYLKSIKFIQKRNGGTASALNTGIQHATGEYFTWLSSDDLYKPEKISRQIQFMRDIGANVSYSPYILVNSQGEQLQQIDKYYQNKIKLLKAALRFCPVNGCTVMIKMNVFCQIGLFDETLRYANDYDMWCRILLNYDIYYLDEALVFYRKHEEMGTIKHKKEIISETKQVKNRYNKQLRKYISKLKKQSH